jgi:hypothetical protein
MWFHGHDDVNGDRRQLTSRVGWRPLQLRMLVMVMRTMVMAMPRYNVSLHVQLLIINANTFHNVLISVDDIGYISYHHECVSIPWIDLKDDTDGEGDQGDKEEKKAATARDDNAESEKKEVKQQPTKPANAARKLIMYMLMGRGSPPGSCHNREERQER